MGEKSYKLDLGYHEHFLKWCGFLPCYPDSLKQTLSSKVKGYLTKAFPFALILGATIQTVVMTLSVIWKFIEGALLSPNQSPLICVLPLVAYPFVNLHTICVLTLMLRNKSRYSQLKQQIAHVARFRDLHIRESHNWRKVTNMLAIGMLALLIAWEFVEWRRFRDSDPRHYLPDYDTVYEPMPMKITLSQAYLFWFAFCSFPYYVSQQIFVVIASFALVLRDCCKQIKEDVVEFRRQLEDTQIFVKQSSIGQKSVDDALHKAAILRKVHLELVVCCEKLNKQFGWILCAVYTFSLAVACSFIAAAVSNKDQLAITSILNVGSVVLFGSYAILFMIPLAQVHEQAEKLPLQIYRLRDQIQVLPANSRLAAELKLLASASKNFVLNISAAGLIPITKEILAWTVTLLVSAAFLAHEVVSREGALDDCPNNVMAKNVTVL